MADSRRIAVDREKTQFATADLPGVSRPDFPGTFATILGRVLFLPPNAFTLLIFSLGFVLIQIQERFGEELPTGCSRYGAYAETVTILVLDTGAFAR